MVTDRQTDKCTDGRNDRPSTVTLTAHVRQGLIIVVLESGSQFQTADDTGFRI